MDQKSWSNYPTIGEFMTYQPGIPTGSIPLNQDYLNIQQNFNQINIQFPVDHVPLTSTSGSPPNGYHTVIHLVPQNAPPPTVGYGQILNNTGNDGFNTDQTLFFQSGNGLLLQLTRNFQPILNTNGSTFMGGGLVIQWGIVNGTHGGDNHFNSGDSGTVTFATANKSFPNACFGIMIQPLYTAGNAPASSSAATFSVANNYTGLSFSWTFSTSNSSTSYTRFFWVAIGW